MPFGFGAGYGEKACKNARNRGEILRRNINIIMDITKIDKNFKAESVTEQDGRVFHLPCAPFAMHGGWYEKDYGFLKMPVETAQEISAGVAWGSRCTAGVRLLFSTDSSFVKITARLLDKCVMTHMPITGSASFSLVQVTDDEEKLVGLFRPAIDTEPTFTAQCTLQGQSMRNYILYFPLYSGVEDLIIELESGCKVQAYEKYKPVAPVLYYGSSITQGGCASRGDNCYQALVGEWLNADYLILGFSGGAKAEPKMIEYLAGVDCSVFVCDYDHNAPSVEHLQNTHLKVYQAFRANPKHKNTPILFLSKPDGHRDDMGEERFKIIKSTYQYAKANGDNNVYLLDGREFYPKRIREHCAVDGCHPNDLGFYFMAEKVYAVLKDLI
jgi:hypothetical protein